MHPFFSASHQGLQHVCEAFVLGGFGKSFLTNSIYSICVPKISLQKNFVLITIPIDKDSNGLFINMLCSQERFCNFAVWHFAAQ
jgi:hypothetical protein